MTFEAYLKTQKNTSNNLIDEAIHYALSAGGKRIRPKLFFSVLESYGIAIEPYYPVALAIEKVHTYSLVHDDLPAMDDDDVRRNQPTVHKQYNEWVAILTGDALLTDAFFDLAQCDALSAQQSKDLVRILALKAGSKGMVYGQTLDMESENQTITFDVLEQIHTHKTAHLIQASLMMGAIVAKPEDVYLWEQIGYHLGILFQIQDDILEQTSDAATLGKSKTDDRKKKQTYVSFLGLEKAHEALKEHQEKVLMLRSKMILKDQAFDTLFKTILNRTH